jgi:hypothetical protein
LFHFNKSFQKSSTVMKMLYRAAKKNRLFERVPKTPSSQEKKNKNACSLSKYVWKPFRRTERISQRNMGTSRYSDKISTYKISTYRSLFLQPNIPTKFVPIAHYFYVAIFLQLVIYTKKINRAVC